MQVLGHPTSGKSTLIQQFRQLQTESGPDTSASARSHEHLGSTGSKLSVANPNQLPGSANTLNASGTRDDSVQTINLHLLESTLELLHNRSADDSVGPISNGGRRRSSGSSAHAFDATLETRKSVHESDANNPFSHYSADLYMVVYAVNNR